MNCIKILYKNLKNVYKICFTKDWIFMRKYVYEYYVKQHPTMKNIIASQERSIELLESMNDSLELQRDLNFQLNKQFIQICDSFIGEFKIAGYDQDTIVEMFPGDNFEQKLQFYNMILDIKEEINKQNQNEETVFNDDNDTDDATKH